MAVFMTTAEVAKERRVSPKWVRKQARQRHIGINIGGRNGWVFSLEEVNEMFAPLHREPVVRRRRVRRSA